MPDQHALTANDLRDVLRDEGRRNRRRQSLVAVVVALFVIPGAVLGGAFLLKALFYVP